MDAGEQQQEEEGEAEVGRRRGGGDDVLDSILMGYGESQEGFEAANAISGDSAAMLGGQDWDDALY
jgi:hypothetical protein